MEFVKLWTTFHDDPKVQRLSDRAFRGYVNALSWSGLHERNGEYEFPTTPPKWAGELVAAGLFSQVSEYVYAIHGWNGRQIDIEDLRAKRSAAGRLGGLAKASNALASASDEPVASALAPAKQSKSKSKSKSEITPSAPRERDALFDALASVTGRDPTAMTRREARACGTAVADIRRASPGLTPTEIERRAENYRLHMPQATLTPSALANHWSLCANPPALRAVEDRASRLAKEIIG